MGTDTEVLGVPILVVGKTDGETVRRFRLEHPVVSIGRAPTNGLVLPAKTVSRVHCVLALRGGRAFLRDVGSAHGTTVNGEPIDLCEIGDGDLICVGPYELLAPVYDWFTEGFDTADLQDAKALLDQLDQRAHLNRNLRF